MIDFALKSNQELDLKIISTVLHQWPLNIHYLFSKQLMKLSSSWFFFVAFWTKAITVPIPIIHPHPQFNRCKCFIKVTETFFFLIINLKLSDRSIFYLATLNMVYQDQNDVEL